jgi:hypothetical protein
MWFEKAADRLYRDAHAAWKQQREIESLLQPEWLATGNRFNDALTSNGLLQQYAKEFFANQSILERDLSNQILASAQSNELERFRRQVELERDIGFELAERARFRAEEISRQQSIAILREDSLQSQLLKQRDILGGYESLFRNATETALGQWENVVGQKLLFEIPQQLAKAATLAEEKGEEIDLAELISQAVVRALSKQGVKADMQFVFGIILSILMFLHQNMSDKKDNEDLDKRLRGLEEKSVDHSHLFDQLARKTVERTASLRSAPKPGSREKSVLQAGLQVVVLQRKGKWTEVVAPVASGDHGLATSGWVLNKYLQ